MGCALDKRIRVPAQFSTLPYRTMVKASSLDPIHRRDFPEVGDRSESFIQPPVSIGSTHPAVAWLAFSKASWRIRKVPSFKPVNANGSSSGWTLRQLTLEVCHFCTNRQPIWLGKVRPRSRFRGFVLHVIIPRVRSDARQLTGTHRAGRVKTEQYRYERHGANIIFESVLNAKNCTIDR